MIDLPAPLTKVMQGKNLDALKPFAVLFRNKWHEESGGEGYFALDTENPVDISAMIEKPNTLSMTLDVNEVAQYKANNVTLTLSDPFNKFIEGTPKSFFNNGYQLYGSQVILYYGLDDINKTPLFVGVIKELPSYKPEQYEVDLKLISPLELLKDIEAKDFSDKYEGETLTANGYDSDNNPIFKTAHDGVGGFYAVYAGATKMFEGVDFTVSQLNTLGFPALVTIKNTSYQSETITADYYCWKKGLSVEQIISGLVALGGYTANTDIKSVVWVNEIKNLLPFTVQFAIGYYQNTDGLIFNWYDGASPWGSLQIINKTVERKSIFPSEFTINFDMKFESEAGAWQGYESAYCFGDERGGNNWPRNGYAILREHPQGRMRILKWENNTIQNPTTGTYASDYFSYNGLGGIRVKNGNVTFITRTGTSYGSYPVFFTPAWEAYRALYSDTRVTTTGIKFSPNTDNLIIADDAEQYTYPVIKSQVLDKLAATGYWGGLYANLQQGETPVTYSLNYASSEDGTNFSELQETNLNTDLGINERYLYFIFQIVSASPNGADLLAANATYYTSSLLLNLVNLGGKSVLDALQDLALISGYEFGVDRQGVFFFRPRSQSTTPIYDLGHDEIVQINNISKKMSDFFTKLTLQFSQTPLEFYANEGEKPTPLDRYGVINKNIDKPDIVNYDNPELAQAIGPQLLAIYSNLSNIVQATGKLNLALELGDIVNLKRSYNLTVRPDASDTIKYMKQQTYFRACKITGLNYNFGNRQITYTLRDVSNENNAPKYDFNEYIYDYAVQFGVKE